MRRLAGRLGARLVVLVCQADDALLLARLAARASDTQTASDARLAIWPELRAAYSEPTELVEAVPVDAGAGPEAMLAQALAIVRESVGSPTAQLASCAPGDLVASLPAARRDVGERTGRRLPTVAGHVAPTRSARPGG